MSEEQSTGTFSLDALLSDVRRMTNERNEAEIDYTAEPKQYWTREDIDRLLGEEDLLAGIPDYTIEDPPKLKPSRRPKKAPVQPMPEPEVEVEPEVEPEPEATPEPPTEPSVSEEAFEQEQLEEAEPTLRVEPKTIQIPSLAAAEAPKAEKDTIDLGALFPSEKKKPKAKPAKALTNEMMDGQIVLQGFETDEAAEPLDEERAEQELTQRRSKKVEKFKLLDFAKKYEPDLPPKKDVIEEKEPGVESTEEMHPPFSAQEEYLRLSDRMRIGKNLQQNRRSAFLSVCAMTVSELVMIVLSVIAGRLEPANRAGLYAVCLVMLSFSVALSVSTIISGLKALFRFKPWMPDCDSAVAVATIGTLLHGIVAFVLPSAPEIPCTFCAAAGFALLVHKIGKLFESIGVLGNFKFCAFAAHDKLHTVRPFADKADSFEIGKNLLVSDPDLRYSEKTKFPLNFFRNSDFRSLVDRFCRILFPAAFLVSLFTALGGWISTKSGLGAFSAFTGALCIAMPATAAFTVTVPSVLLMLHVNSKGGMIASPTAASANAHCQGLAVESVDLYDTDLCEMDDFADYGAIRLDDMFLYAAAMMVASDSPLTNAFLRIVGNPDILPPVKNLIFEEKLGLSATIHGQSVLLGNRNLLLNHSVSAPPKSIEFKHIQEGKRVLYMTIGNKIAAMFILSYIENDNLIPSLAIMQDNGISLVVHAPDANLTADFLNEGLALHSVKLMSPLAGDLLRRRQNTESEFGASQLMHDGSTESLVRTIAGAATIHNIQRVAAFIATIGCGIGWLVGFILMLVRDISAFNWVFVIVYTLVWLTVSTTLGIIRMRKAKK